MQRYGAQAVFVYVLMHLEQIGLMVDPGPQRLS
jgi:hypothetical protein